MTLDRPLDETLAKELESVAAGAARGAGELLRGYFGGPIEVDYKDKKKERDPVTRADKEAQAYLKDAILDRFPDHEVLGEEDPERDEVPSSDFLWVLDPLDGTTNFVNGLPVYGVSVGVLHRGIPVAGALLLPWPGEAAGRVLHARRGGGAWAEDTPIAAPQQDAPRPNRLTGLPGSFGGAFRVQGPLRGKLGEPRVTGSIAYELGLAAFGVFQYVLLGGPRIWDVAAGVLIVMEAGGSVLIRPAGERGWRALETLGPAWDDGPPSLKTLRAWSRPMIAGTPDVAAFVAENLKRRYSLRARVRRLWRR